MGLAERASSLFGPPTPVKETVEEQGFFLGLIHFEEFVQDAERGVRSEDQFYLFTLRTISTSGLGDKQRHYFFL